MLIGSYDTHLYALDAAPGKLRWKLQTDGPVHATPAVQNGVVYIGGCDEQFRAVRARRRQGAVRDPARLQHRLVGGDRRATARTSARSTPTCSRIDLQAREGRVALPRSGSRVPVLLVGGALTPAARVIIGGRDKAIHAIDAATGKSAWKFVTRARVDSSPVVAGGRVFVGSSDGKLYVLDAASGKKRWEFEAGDAITASPADRRRPRRHRRAGRPDLLLRIAPHSTLSARFGVLTSS